MDRRISIPSAAASAIAAAMLLAACSSGGGGDTKTTSASTAASSAATSSAATSSSASSSAASGDLSSLSADQILTKTKAAVTAAKSVKVAGAIVENGAETKLDLSYAEAGMSGSVTTQGFKIDLIALGNTIYFKAPDAFFTKTLGAKAPAVLKVVSGKWIKGSVTDSGFTEFADFSSKDKFFDGLLTNDSALSKGENKNINGTDCVALKDSTGTLYVAADDARPIQLVGGEATSTGELDFTDYNQVPTPTAPPASDTVSGTSLG